MLSLPIAAALAFAPAQQDPAKAKQELEPAEVAKVLSISEMQYVNLQGKTVTVPARNVVEIRVLQAGAEGVQLELLYDNGDYSLIHAQAMHVLRNLGATREVRLVRSGETSMRFPNLP